MIPEKNKDYIIGDMVLYDYQSSLVKEITL